MKDRPFLFLTVVTLGRFCGKLGAVFVAASVFGLTALGMNPILPGTAFIPDSQPHVYDYNGEKRVFIYGSRDERVTAYCGYGHDTWSAPVDDLTKWTNHGEIFNVKQVQDIGFGRVKEQHFGAPDCEYNPVTKKYYLYTFLGMPYKADGKEGPDRASDYVPGFGGFGPKAVMAVSDSPAGPFLHPVICDWPAANKMGAFDPGVLVDPQPDGSVRVYAYWGAQGGDRSAEIDPTDMHTIINSQTRQPDRNAWHRTLAGTGMKGSGLFEASSIRKVADGIYVYIYSASKDHSALTYCYSSSPDGPWTYGGKIVTNALGWNGGNGHGGIVKINDRWFVFYHRATSNDFNRQAMAEPIDLTIQGGEVIIPHVEMTSEGVETEGLDAFRRYNAGVACYHNEKIHIEGNERNADGLNPLVGIDHPGATIGYKYLNFGTAPVTDADQLKLKLNVRMLAPTSISVLVAPVGNTPDETSQRVKIAQVKLQDFISADGKFDEAVIPIIGLDGNAALQAMGGLKGKRAVYLSFDGSGEMCRLKEIEFAKGDAPTPNPLRDVTISPDIPNGEVKALPIKGRPGDSIKLTVFPSSSYHLKSIRVVDEKGAEIRLNPNCAAPDAPQSFNFEMPNTEVRVSSEFTHD